MAATEYLAFLDSDDMMSPNSLEDRREILNSDPFACAAYSPVRLISPQSLPMDLNGTKEAIINFTDLVENKFITSCIFSRTQILKQLGGFDKAFKFGEKLGFVASNDSPGLLYQVFARFFRGIPAARQQLQP